MSLIGRPLSRAILRGVSGCVAKCQQPVIRLQNPVQTGLITRQFQGSKVSPKDKDDDQAAPEVEDDTVVIERIEHLHIMTIGINRPEKRNCIDFETATKLLTAFNEFESEESMYCAVLHGLGGNFCAGFDLDELATLDQDNLANTIAMSMMDRGPMGPTRLDLSKPVIAAIDGWCVAGGLELALMADLRVADVDAKMGVLNRRFGVPLIDGGTVRLPELIGLSRALDVILTGRIIESEEALSMGLVNRVVKTGQAYGRAMHLAKELIAHPQACLRADRASCYHATFASKSLEQSLQHESENALPIISQVWLFSILFPNFFPSWVAISRKKLTKLKLKGKNKLRRPPLIGRLGSNFDISLGVNSGS